LIGLIFMLFWAAYALVRITAIAAWWLVMLLFVTPARIAMRHRQRRISGRRA
jgi:hypothetical protein